ncbi:hypothetical protein [Streptomyces sp. MK7]|uniref:hypothetical protein n=1 Tax=Streptomyces sp. MK7 TaxID=3067635 RepID=UPI00292D1DB7|nr:hypothetical protein [Streptomyces sp. MK7]
MRNKTRLLLVPVLAAGLLATSTAWETAAAASEDCSSWPSNSGQTGNVKCDSRSGVRQHRTVVTCINSGGAKWTITGPWRYRNRVSSATCSVSGTAGVFAIGQERRFRG